MEVKLEIAKIYYHFDKVYQADAYLNKVLQKDPENTEALALRKVI
jgi:hypothetical protein